MKCLIMASRITSLDSPSSRETQFRGRRRRLAERCAQQWPVAESDQREILFCGEAAVSGCPYCAAHETIAYRPVTADFRARRLRGHHPRCP